jgi:hypothetical protein
MTRIVEIVVRQKQGELFGRFGLVRPLHPVNVQHPSRSRVIIQIKG